LFGACGVLSLALIAAVLFRAPEPARAAAADEYNFDAKAALKVTMRSQVQHCEYLDQPSVKRLGGRAFLAGRRVAGAGWVYLPVDEVAYIEEYVNRDDMIKAYPNLAPKAAPTNAGEAPKTTAEVPPKKN